MAKKTFRLTDFILPTSQYDKARADHAVAFIQSLKHTKGVWSGRPFHLLGWQEEIIRNIFGVVKATGYRQFNTAFVETGKKNGKQLALYTQIPTPNGYARMYDLAVGDTVFDEQGERCKVVAKSKIDYSEQAYRIRFKDGEIIEAGENHQWYGEWRVGHRLSTGIVNTGWLYERSLSPHRKDSLDFRIPMNGALDMPDAKLPIHPYLFGYWLGNGHHCKPEITMLTRDVDNVLGRVAPHHEVTAIWQNVGDSKIARIPDLRCILLKSHRDKVIPIEYLRASRKQRLFFLQGLMDSDGCISGRKGQAVYCSTEKPLAESVSELLWTLGIKNAISFAPCTQRADWGKPSAECGRVLTGETMYAVKFTAFRDTQVAGLERKQRRAVKRNPSTRSHYRYIDKIEPIENPGMQCIQVDSPSHLYLAGRSCVPTHNSELAAAIALYMLCADGEEGAEIYGCANDRNQASIVFDVARDMILQCPALLKRVKIVESQKRIIYLPTRGVYQALSSEVASKYGYNVHACIFDELLGQPNRKLYDVMTKGSGAARKQPLNFVITTAGHDRNSICYEVHQKALDILEGRKHDPTFYPVVYSAPSDADWTDPAVWRSVNPSLGVTVDEEYLRLACESAKQNPAEEMQFRQFFLCQWTSTSIRWMPMDKWDACAFPVIETDLEGRVCYGGLDLSSTTDITAFVLVFPPTVDEEIYTILPFFWIPEETLDLRVRRDHVPYDIWQRQGFIQTTEGNVVHYGHIETFIEELGTRYDIREIAFDRWGATQMVQNLEGLGFTVVPFGQGFKDMSPSTKELMRLVLDKKVAHGGHPALRWMIDNIHIRTDPAGNIKPDKEKSTEKIDGAVATVMALDRALRGGGAIGGSVYDERGLIIIG